MVRRGTAEAALRRSLRPDPVRERRLLQRRARRDLVGAVAASASALAVRALAAVLAPATVLALAVGAVAPLASAPSRAADAPARCGDARDLLVASAVLDPRSDALAGRLVACVDEERGRLTIHNRTPVVWVLGGPGVTGVVSQVGGVNGLLSSHAARSGLGLALAPGASASVSAGPSRLSPRPDREATRFFLTLLTIVEAQDAARSSAPPRAPRSAVRTAASRCAQALVDAGASPPDAAPPVLAAASADPSCRGVWRTAGRVALGDGWRLPDLAAALTPLPTGEARAEAASDWFSASSAFSWGGVDHPHRGQ